MKNQINRQTRRFTTQALEHTELLTLQVSDLFVMHAEFSKEFDELFSLSMREELKQDLHFKMDVIRKRELENAKKNQ